MQIPVMHITAIENPERKYVGIIVQSHVTIYLVMDGWTIRAKIRLNPHLHLLFFFFFFLKSNFLYIFRYFSSPSNPSFL